MKQDVIVAVVFEDDSVFSIGNERVTEIRLVGGMEKAFPWIDIYKEGELWKSSPAHRVRCLEYQQVEIEEKF